MKTNFFVMAMMIVGAMCGCTAQENETGCDVFKTLEGTTVKMYCIKHGSMRMQVGDKWIYVDPVTTAVKPETDYSTLPKADYILVTHEHFDHLDSVAINQLTKDGTVLITNARCHEMLGGKGEVMANGAVKGFGIVDKAEIDVFLELSCFFDDPADVGNLISGSSAFLNPA